jgi:hypothetical protein
MLSRLRSMIQSATNPQLRADPPAATADVTETPGAFEGDVNLSESEAEFINSQLENDPDYQELIKSEPGKEKVVEKPEPTDDETEESDEPTSELLEIDRTGLKKIVLDEELDVKITKDMSDDQIREAIDAARAENQANAEVDDEEIEFEDNVIDGLKGEDLKAMSKDGRNSVAAFFQKAKEHENSAKTAQTELQKLLADPIVRHRKELIDTGRSEATYQLPEVDHAELQRVFSETDDSKAAKMVEGIAHRMAKTIIDNEKIESDKIRRARETDATGESILFDAGNMHPEFRISEKDLSKLKPGHPEYERYQKSHGVIVNYCLDKGLNYAYIAKMSPKALYAMVAVENGWPVAENTQKRDLKMIANATQSALAPFMKHKPKGEATTIATKGRDGSTAIKGTKNAKGIDEVKLASDDKYHDHVLSMRPYDVKWVDEVSSMRESGEKKLANRRK